MHTSVMSGKNDACQIFSERNSPKIVDKGSSGMERQTPTGVVSDQDLCYLHRLMSFYF